MMTEFVALFCEVDGSFKLFVEKLRPILNLLTLKTNEYMGYDVI